MTVAELIQRLQALPPDAYVGMVYDGAYRLNVDHVWLARSGVVMLCNGGASVDLYGDQPEEAPLPEGDDQNETWTTPTVPRILSYQSFSR